MHFFFIFTELDREVENKKKEETPNYLTGRNEARCTLDVEGKFGFDVSGQRGVGVSE